VLAKAHAAGRSLESLTPFSLGVLSNSTLDFIIPALIGSAPRHGIALTCIPGEYDLVLQEALSPNSEVNRAKPDAVLIAVDFRCIQLGSALGSSQAAETVFQNTLNYLKKIRSGIRSNSQAACIFQTFAPPPERLLGSFDRVLAGTLRNVIDRLNEALVGTVRGTEDILFDVAGIAETVGLADWHSPAQWNLAKLAFANRFLPLYADHVTRLAGALRGKSRRCLVLDLDNTLWGGVIGDDGLQGIQCAQGDPTGEAHLSLQRFALELRARGIIIAVCSKNNDEVARLPFRNHAEMLLREEHISVFKANWNDKAANMQAIAKELALGLESLVFVDDNPFERGLIRQLLPQVAVPELPSDPALYARTLAAAGYFESVVVSDEDLRRADFYRDTAHRVTLQSAASDVDAYLASLNMEITFQPFDHVGRARITQLINKSNQFNLTTRRYTEAQVAALESDPDSFTLQVRLADVFGDNGMISVVICRTRSDGEWEIDTWLMSCRVLGRRVEKMVLSAILEHARARGIQRLIGTYRPTERNKLVENHYSELGFAEVPRRADGTTIWELSVNTAVVESAPMAVRSFGFETLHEI
jgi:FkbH-like protein